MTVGEYELHISVGVHMTVDGAKRHTSVGVHIMTVDVYELRTSVGWTPH